MTRDFVGRVVRLVAVTHVGVAIAWGELAYLVGAPHPRIVGLIAAALFIPLIGPRFQGFRWDYPRPRWKLHLVDEPFFVHACAAVGAFPILLVTWLAVLLAHLVHLFHPTSPGHDALLLAARLSLITYVTLLVISAWGVWIRRRLVVIRRHRIAIRGLPQAFEGYRIAQLSDLHVGGLTPPYMAERWVRMTLELDADLVVITGDLVTAGTAFHASIAQVVGQLEAPDGVLLSMGNHDYFGDGEPLLTLLRERGLRVLRNESVCITRGDAQIRIAGVDDTYTQRANVETTMEEREAGGQRFPTIVLAHDPDLFDALVEHGADLVLSGHTHGGQVAVPWLASSVSFIRGAHRYVRGMYASGDTTLLVNAGLGTTGPPIRIGVAPEIALLSLTRR